MRTFMPVSKILPYQWWAQEHSCQAPEFGDTDPSSQQAMPLPDHHHAHEDDADDHGDDEDEDILF